METSLITVTLALFENGESGAKRSISFGVMVDPDISETLVDEFARMLKEDIEGANHYAITGEEPRA